MSSSENTNQEFEVFDQREYDNKFYYCDDAHPFIAFTTCYCPFCDIRQYFSELFVEKEELETAFDDLSDEYYELVAAAKKFAPEILV
jgi:hypothetical protein